MIWNMLSIDDLNSTFHNNRSPIVVAKKIQVSEPYLYFNIFLSQAEKAKNSENLISNYFF